MNEFESDSNINVNKPSIKNLKNSELVASWFLRYFYRHFLSKEVKVNPFDSLILKAHYNFTSHLFLTGFVFVTSHWLVQEPIICIDRSDRSRASEELLDICFSYPYVEFPLNNDKNKMVRRYALYYRWVHIACMVLSFLYKGVILMQKIFGFKKFNTLLQDMCDANLQDRYWIAKRYCTRTIGCHNNMYIKFIFIHFMALSINILCFAALNITFQNQYWDLPKNLLAIREPSTFHDRFSLIFPPFTKCEITSVHHILVQRKKWFGCHLPLMEIYEKVFMIIWFWQVFLGIWTTIYIIVNIPLPFMKKWKLNMLCNTSFNRYEPFKICSKKFNTDDIMALSTLKCLLLGNDYVKLLWNLSGGKINFEESLDPNDTVYFDNEPCCKENISTDALANSTSYQSCSQEQKNSHIPLGFEIFTTPPRSSKNFNPVTTSTMLKFGKENNLTLSRWKSAECKIQSPENNIGFNTKLCPLMNYLQRDNSPHLSKSESVLNNSSPSAPEVENSNENKDFCFREPRGNNFVCGKANRNENCGDEVGLDIVPVTEESQWQTHYTTCRDAENESKIEWNKFSISDGKTLDENWDEEGNVTNFRGKKLH